MSMFIGDLVIRQSRPSARPNTAYDRKTVEVSFTDANPIEVIELLESVLATVKARYMAKMDRPAPVDDDEEDLLEGG